ncbi:cytochrome c and c1 heme-lyase [Hypoxylon trugodes]|uniref:cytochrome c and c1 heme-lyase n=1 Tax=Hypoxylon trugodes TaxID=326681 RepID=UPI002193EFC7|nr:cytochrome c and c1 heme-lyase [Hypoxylon trugodes]KAI1388988.1 cytochrome c and c1 heme-lyase [Hypoxylon trugodes]
MSDAKEQAQAACPVDHKSREAWLSQARAANGEISPQSQSLPPSHPPIPSAATKDSAESCPVDHKAREAWLQQASRSAPVPSPPTSQQPPASTSTSSWTSYIPRIPFFASPPPTTTQSQNPRPPLSSLGTDREISTIPRTSKPADETLPTATPHIPANTEQETGADEVSGNWIYPSEKMFFEAMKRKGHDPRAVDMRTVVPIHNAVNERAWAEIKAWEEPWVRGSICDGPRLHSFSGLSTHMSPRARFNTLLGYQAPFDRHDWVVDRCGKEIEYVIDFYAGRNGGTAVGANGKLSFYLDVRPKLNTWEGVKMRAMRATGLI